MITIILTEYFQKQLKKIKRTKEEIIYQVSKYKNNTNAYINIGTYDGFVVCKDYMAGGKIRLLVFNKLEQYYLPVIIVKKNSIKGKNIRKNNIQNLFESTIKKTLNDFANKRFEVVKV